MNGFADRGLSEADFSESRGISVKSFDAFPKTKPSYLTQSRSGGAWTLLLLLTGLYLVASETRRWFAGTTTHSFSVEKGVAHTLQLNLDVVVAMQCADVHVNVQDAAGDRILAGETLKKDPTVWKQWKKGLRKGEARVLGEGGWQGGMGGMGREDEDVHEYLGAARKKSRFAKTPKVRGEPDACRVYGSLEGNKVQGDFHITARGHGYVQFGEQHLDHNRFNFSHIINELSFGPFYPGLTNPLDNTYATTPSHFFKYQYYLSIVPTIYTDDASSLARSPHYSSLLSTSSDGPEHPLPHLTFIPRSTIHTNQYAVTSQSHPVGELQVPGVFVKYDFEPILLVVAEEWGGTLALAVRLVNVVAGLMVAGGWCWRLSEWVGEVWGRRRRRRESMGVLHGGEKEGEKGF